jgi:hypothetical protein
MYPIDATFRPLKEVSLQETVGAIGVYVLWNRAADVRPSYLGQGVLLERIIASTKEFGTNLEGYIAIMQKGGESRRKTDAQILEHTLLVAAKRIDQFPTRNQLSGNLAALFKRGAAGHEMIRVNVRGHHPLRWNCALRNTNSLVWRWDDFTPWVLEEVPWRRS